MGKAAKSYTKPPYNYGRLKILGELRRDKHISQKEVAEYFGLESKSGRNKVSDWEHGNGTPARHHRDTFIRYLGEKLDLRANRERFDEVWTILQEEWGWLPVTNSEWRSFFPDTPTLALPSPLASAEAALDLFTALPLDKIPDATTLPLGSRMPFSRNPLFVGRGEDLKRLAMTLKGGGTTAIGQIAAAAGLGGIGKTQLAAEFVHRYGCYFAGGVFWLSFGDADVVPAEIVACGGAGAMNLLGFDALKFDDQIARVRQEWQSPVPRLLIFDNCEDEGLLAKWRPISGGCRVLVTSRRSQWEAVLGVTILALDVLSREESAKLLQNFRKHLSDTDADAIATELGDLPLALHLAGSYLARYKNSITAGQYLLELRSPELLEHPSMKGRGLQRETSATFHEQHVGRTFALSYDRLDTADSIDAVAKELLIRAAYFAAGELFPRDLLLATLGSTDTALDRTLEGEDALARLIELGLLEENKDTGLLRLHRLMAAFVRSQAANSAVQEAVEQAVLEIADRLNKARDPSQLLALQLHLRTLTDAAKGREDERAATLCHLLGTHLCNIGEYDAARPYLERALEIREVALGEDHPHIIETLEDHGTLLLAQGDYSGARHSFERALTNSERRLNHLFTARCLNNLGILLQDQGKYDEARSYFERALAIWERELGPNHSETAFGLNNLGLQLWYEGDYAGARSYYERALAIRQQEQGERHPDTVICLNNLGALFWSQKDYEASRVYLERALAIRREVLPEHHPDVAISLNNLGVLLRDQEKYDQARVHLEQALELRQQVLGPAHPDTGQSLSNLGTLFKAQGKYTDARTYFERALATWEHVLEPTHPWVTKAREHLAALC